MALNISKVPGDGKVICPWCEKEETVDKWDELSFKECVSREQRRAYKHLSDPKVWGVNSTNFFKCPLCGQWVRGNKLRLNTTDGELRKLGGQSLVEVNGRKFDFNP